MPGLNVPHSQLAPLPTELPFRIVSKTIGSGAYACIKKGAPLHDVNPVFAVKFINKDYAQRYGRIKKKQIDMEITLHKHIGVHKHIIEHYLNGEDEVWTWIAMELAEGGDLFDKIEADAGVTEDIAHVYFAQLISAMAFMHSKGVGHRDIKPENILLSADGDLKLADFGMATLFEYHGKRKTNTTMCGSPPYIAPEVLACGSVTGEGYVADAADIWSCGVVLFVLLAGNTPWDRPVEGVDDHGRLNEFSEYIKKGGKPNDELWDGLPSEVLSLLRGMLSIDLNTRFSLEAVRRHPWFTRPNPYMDSDGRLTNPLSLATNMFESLKISFDADPLAKLSQRMDMMDISVPAAKARGFSTSQPDTAVEDMLFDWERPSRLMASSTQPQGLPTPNISSTQSILQSQLFLDEPSMSQFAITPSVPISRTQMARKFRDILPAQSLTKLYSTWTLNLLVPVLVEKLSLLGIATASIPRPSAQDYECNIKVRTKDDRSCALSGDIAVDVVTDGLVEVNFVKGNGDPLQWRRLFKKMAVLCKDAVVRPDV